MGFCDDNNDLGSKFGMVSYGSIVPITKQQQQLLHRVKTRNIPQHTGSRKKAPRVK